MAQLAHESAGFTKFSESLYYKDPKRVALIFKTAFDENHDGKISQSEIERAKPYCCNPVAMANKVYANRLGNRNEASGDGYKYRGRGPIQITFANNYRACSIAIFGDERLLKDPDFLLQPLYGALAAGWYWRSNRIGLLADADDFEGVTRKINPGMAGLEDRREWLLLAEKTIN